jgi:hypothetical protein
MLWLIKAAMLPLVCLALAFGFRVAVAQTVQTTLVLQWSFDGPLPGMRCVRR